MYREKGQTLIEVIVAATVGILVVTALTFATIFSLRNANFAKSSALATKLTQEGIEKVRAGRDRDNAVTISGGSSDCITLDSCTNTPTTCNVTSWKGDSGTSAGSIWNYQIYTGCGSGGDCYFNVDSGGALNPLTTSSSFPTSGAEDVYSDNKFLRAVIVSDDSSSCTVQKKVTVVVKWNDATGDHFSKLTTILRKL